MNGNYALSIWFQSSGGQNWMSYGADNFGGSKKENEIPRSAVTTWTKLTLTGINVTNGQCEIFVWSDAPTAPRYLLIDDVALVKE